MSVLLICSDSNDLQAQVVTFLHQQKLLSTTASLENNPDLHWINTPEENITIEAVRQLNQEVLLKPYSSPTSIFVIFNIDLGSIAAQNALLKLLEEPPAYAQIILTARTVSTVLPTIQSRCKKSLVSTFDSASSETPTNAAELADMYSQLKKASLSQVIELSEKYKERADALTFVTQMLEWLHRHNQQQPQPKQTTQLERLVKAESLLRKNVNVRLVIEDCFFNF